MNGMISPGSARHVGRFTVQFIAVHPLIKGVRSFNRSRGVAGFLVQALGAGNVKF